MRPHLPPIRLEAESQREHQDLDLTSVRRASLRIEFEDGHHAHSGLAISVHRSLTSSLQPPGAHLEACARLRGAGLLDAGDHVLGGVERPACRRGSLSWRAGADVVPGC